MSQKDRIETLIAANMYLVSIFIGNDRVRALLTDEEISASEEIMEGLIDADRQTKRSK